MSKKYDSKSILYSPSWAAGGRGLTSSSQQRQTQRQQQQQPAPLQRRLSSSHIPIYTAAGVPSSKTTATTTHVFLQPRVLRRSGSNEYQQRTGKSYAGGNNINTSPLLASPASSHNSSSRGSSPASSPFASSPTNRNSLSKNASTTTPFLTLALLKLHELSGAFCQTMALPTFDNACLACARMDSSFASVNTPRSPSVSPNKKTKRTPRRGGSPLSRSPLLSWLTPKNPSGPLSSDNKSRNKNDDPHTATAVQAEWDDFQRPFVCWAAAEVWYAEMAHWIADQEAATAHASSSAAASHSNKACALQRLYLSLETEFLQIRQHLCVPFLPSDSMDQDDSSTQTSASAATTTTTVNVYTEAAKKLSATLVGLAELCACRACLVDAQANMVQVISQTHNECDTHVLYQDMRGMVQAQINLRQLYKTSRAFAPIHDAWKEELQAWKHLLTAAESLEKCLYMESIVSLRQLQKTLTSRTHTTNTRLWEWMQDSWNEYKSLLPVYFDRVLVTAQPLYHFETTAMPCERDTKILQFLRQQEKLGGPPTAIAVVLDAVGTQNLHVERGFVLGNGTTNSSNKSAVVPQSSSALTTDARIIWPAVYMRSSLFLSSERSNVGASNAGSRSSSRSSFGALAPQTHLSLTSLGSNGAAQSTKQSSSSLATKLLEYGADTEASATQWPHSEWASLASCLAETTIEEEDEESRAESTITVGAVLSVRMAHEPMTATFREDAGSLVKQPALDNISSSVRFDENHDTSFWKFIPGIANAWKHHETNHENDASRSNSLTQFGHGVPGMEVHHQTSTFHVVSLSSFLSLVVIVKPDAADGSFLRRRSRLNDEEIQGFLNAMADSMRVSRRFTPRCLPKHSHQHKRGRKLPHSLLELPPEVAAGEMMSAILKRVKGAFGLRPASPFQDKHRGFSILPQRSKDLNSRGASSIRDESSASFSKSAEVLFLGGDLAGFIEKV